MGHLSQFARRELHRPKIAALITALVRGHSHLAAIESLMQEPFRSPQSYPGSSTLTGKTPTFDAGRHAIGVERMELGKRRKRHYKPDFTSEQSMLRDKYIRMAIQQVERLHAICTANGSGCCQHAVSA